MMYKLFSVCVPVKGFSRSIIYDLNREKYNFIPNALFELISENNILDLQYLLERYPDNKNTILEYFDFLLENEYIFKIAKNEKELFPNLDLSWDIPAHISNSIIEFSKVNQNNLENILFQINELGCRNLQFLIKKITIKEIQSLICTIERYKFNHIEIIFKWKYFSFANMDELINLISNSTRRIRIIFEESYKKELKSINNDKNQILHFTETYYKSRLKSINAFFSINLELFTESQNFNNYWNRKLSINSRGQVVNNFIQRKIIGDLTTGKLLDLIRNENTQELWYVKKDNIKVCKDCEFRYMCVDPRMPIKKGDSYTFEEKCVYDPYKMTWNEK